MAMSNEADHSEKPFAPHERKRIRATVDTVDGWVTLQERREWLIVQSKMWIKWAGSSMAVVAFVEHFWPTIVDIVTIILKASQ